MDKSRSIHPIMLDPYEQASDELEKTKYRDATIYFWDENNPNYASLRLELQVHNTANQLGDFALQILQWEIVHVLAQHFNLAYYLKTQILMPLYGKIYHYCVDHPNLYMLLYHLHRLDNPYAALDVESEKSFLNDTIGIKFNDPPLDETSFINKHIWENSVRYLILQQQIKNDLNENIFYALNRATPGAINNDFTTQLSIAQTLISTKTIDSMSHEFQTIQDIKNLRIKLDLKEGWILINKYNEKEQKEDTIVWFSVISMFNTSYSCFIEPLLGYSEWDLMHKIMDKKSWNNTANIIQAYFDRKWLPYQINYEKVSPIVNMGNKSFNSTKHSALEPFKNVDDVKKMLAQTGYNKAR